MTSNQTQNQAADQHRWIVFHPDGAEWGLKPVSFRTKKEAMAKAKEWNKDYSGHRVLRNNTLSATK